MEDNEKVIILIHGKANVLCKMLVRMLENFVKIYFKAEVSIIEDATISYEEHTEFELETNVEAIVLDIVSIIYKRMHGQYNDSFKYEESIMKWKGLCHKRISVERFF